MLEEIRAGNVATVIIKDQSRIGRDVVEVGLLKRTFDEYHVRFIAANDNLDTANGFDIMSIFRDVINEWYVADTSRKQDRFQVREWKRAWRCSGSVSYGYLASKENKGEWVIDEEAAGVVRRIFQSVVAGESIASIARALRAEKIPIPSEHWKRIGAPGPGGEVHRPLRMVNNNYQLYPQTPGVHGAQGFGENCLRELQDQKHPQDRAGGTVYF